MTSSALVLIQEAMVHDTRAFFSSLARAEWERIELSWSCDTNPRYTARHGEGSSRQGLGTSHESHGCTTVLASEASTVQVVLGRRVVESTARAGVVEARRRATTVRISCTPCKRMSSIHFVMNRPPPPANGLAESV